MPELNREQIIAELQEIIDHFAGSLNRYWTLSNALTLIKQLTEEKRAIFEEQEQNLNNLITYYKEKRKYVTEVDYSELEQRYCDIKIRTFQERLLKIADLKKKYIGE